jgi:hypothetical protein
MFHNVEFRDGRHYDFVVNNPAILTVEVGDPNPTPAAIMPNEQFVKPDDLDDLLKKFSSEIEQLKPNSFGTPSQTRPNHQTQQSKDNNAKSTHYSQSSMTMEDAEIEKQMWVDRLHQSYQIFLEYVQSQAKNYAKALVEPESQQPSPKPKLLELLDTSSFPSDEWRRKLNEIQSYVKLSEVKDVEYDAKLRQDLELQQDTTVGSHIASALNDHLTQRKETLLQDIKSIYHAQQYQNHLLTKMTSSYVTFYSWMLEQWNRSIREINNTYSKVHQRIEMLWSKDPIHQDINQLLQRYERFLQAYETHLPLEFTLSVNPRKEWREYMAKQQPEECIRLMKNELHALENTPALRKSLDVWKRELNQYDVTRLHKMNENRQRMKKRIEDAVDVETKQTCQRKWKELNERIYKMGTDLQIRANQKFQEYNTQYQQQQLSLLGYNERLQREIQAYERRLALIDKPWATWMEKRKMAIKEWANHNYWQVSIASLLQVYDVVVEFKRYVETQQDAKLE